MAEEIKNVPRHVAIILDGNGRWAKQRNLPRTMGHKAGADNVETISDVCIAMGIRYLTVYAFSTENWKRSEDEVSYLMGLMRWYLKNYLDTALRKGIRMRVIGDRSGLDPEMVEEIRRDEELTAHLTNLELTFAINYGGRDEIVRAVKDLAEDIRKGEILPEDITEEQISRRLDTRELPDPDLMIRTSGEERLSNFLLWQLAYSEFCFTDKYWPDFSEEDLRAAVDSYSRRERRFGGRKQA
ncbi:MAG: isoprenyl transferase [Lachnospiraceae bacterium]|nr:isoprenyl transferase [Lachnospiraceae bacterium]